VVEFSTKKKKKTLLSIELLARKNYRYNKNLSSKERRNNKENTRFQNVFVSSLGAAI